jgi:hypothetical protein
MPPRLLRTAVRRRPLQLLSAAALLVLALYLLSVASRGIGGRYAGRAGAAQADSAWAAALSAGAEAVRHASAPRRAV